MSRFIVKDTSFLKTRPDNEGDFEQIYCESVLKFSRLLMQSTGNLERLHLLAKQHTLTWPWLLMTCQRGGL